MRGMGESAQRYFALVTQIKGKSISRVHAADKSANTLEISVDMSEHI